VGPRAGQDGQKILSPPGFDPGPSSRESVAIPNELTSPHIHTHIYTHMCLYMCMYICVCVCVCIYIYIYYIYV